MTNFDRVKTWDSKRFSEFTLKLIINTINVFSDIDTSEVRYKVVVKNFQQWLDKEVDEDD